MPERICHGQPAGQRRPAVAAAVLAAANTAEMHRCSCQSDGTRRNGLVSAVAMPLVAVRQPPSCLNSVEMRRRSQRPVPTAVGGCYVLRPAGRRDSAWRGWPSRGWRPALGTDMWDLSVNVTFGAAVTFEARRSFGRRPWTDGSPVLLLVAHAKAAAKSFPTRHGRPQAGVVMAVSIML